MDTRKNQPRESKGHIDKDKITENPGTLPYAHTIGSAEIKPYDESKIKGKAMAAMYEQTNANMHQIREQIDNLILQAKEIHKRTRISEKIYEAIVGFEPIIGNTYHLYIRPSKECFLSLVAPEEWGRSAKFNFVATVKMYHDHTWEILETTPDFDDWTADINYEG